MDYDKDILDDDILIDDVEPEPEPEPEPDYAFDDFVKTVKAKIRNYFNVGNFEDEEAEDSEKYQRFLRLCQRMYDWTISPAGKHTNKTSENVFGSYSFTRATDKDGKPLTVFDVFADELSEFKVNMFSRFLHGDL